MNETWMQKLEQEKAASREKVYTVHVSLPGKTNVYVWLKQQAAKHQMPLARIAALILEEAMQRDQPRGTAV